MPTITIPVNHKESWLCPHCYKAATMREGDDIFTASGKIENHDGGRATYTFKAYSCPNPQCRKLSIRINISDNIANPTIHIGEINSSYAIKQYRDRQKIDLDMMLIPFGNAREWPEYVNKNVREDYKEACLVLSFSPKASATLLRRCLQTIIRDFWKIERGTLYEEIKAIPDEKIDPELKQLFLDLKDAGNFGAHLSEETLYLEMSQEEAETIIEFIETVIDKTYIQAEKDKQLSQKMNDIGEKFTSKSKANKNTSQSNQKDKS